MSQATDVDIRARDKRITTLKGVIYATLTEAATEIRMLEPLKDKVFYTHGNPTAQISVSASQQIFDSVQPEDLRERMAVAIEGLRDLAINKANRFNASTFYCFNEKGQHIRVVITVSFKTD